MFLILLFLLPYSKLLWNSRTWFFYTWRLPKTLQKGKASCTPGLNPSAYRGSEPAGAENASHFDMQGKHDSAVD